jgi:transcriptional regulator with XRE-family HTH domain
MKGEMNMTTKERLKYLYNHGVPLTEFAKRLNCSKTTLGRWLRGESNLSERLERDLNSEINKYLSELEEIKE